MSLQKVLSGSRALLARKPAVTGLALAQDAKNLHVVLTPPTVKVSLKVDKQTKRQIGVCKKNKLKPQENEPEIGDKSQNIKKLEKKLEKLQKKVMENITSNSTASNKTKKSIKLEMVAKATFDDLSLQPIGRTNAKSKEIVLSKRIGEKNMESGVMLDKGNLKSVEKFKSTDDLMLKKKEKNAKVVGSETDTSKSKGASNKKVNSILLDKAIKKSKKESTKSKLRKNWMWKYNFSKEVNSKVVGSETDTSKSKGASNKKVNSILLDKAKKKLKKGSAKSKFRKYWMWKYKFSRKVKSDLPMVCKKKFDLSKEKVLKICFWNVAGLRKKSKSFWNFVTEMDVIGFTETWISKRMWLRFKKKLPLEYDWKCYFALNARRGARPRRGIITGVRKDLAVEGDGYFSTDIMKSEVNLGERKIQIITAYRAQSSYLEEEFWKALENELQPNDYLIIGGDFNARTGNMGGVRLDGLEQIRKSKDSKLDKNGKNLIDLCEKKDWTILNGNLEAGEGKFTYVRGYRGNSVIDYAIASKEILPFVMKFYVETRRDSDHMPLMVEINLEKFLNRKSEEKQDDSKSKDV